MPMLCLNGQELLALSSYSHIRPNAISPMRRLYVEQAMKPELFYATDVDARRTVAYARVSSKDQQADLERQKTVLELYCARQGWTFDIVSDLGSGMNYHKKGLRSLLDAILEGKVGRLVITHKDRLLRFGAELVFAICEAKKVEVVILNQGEDTNLRGRPGKRCP